MINDPFHPEEAIARQKESSRRKLLAVVCAVGLTAVLLIGYAVMRRQHAERVVADAVVPVTPETGPKGPPLVHLLIDEPTLEKGVTTIGGVVKNISNQELTGLHVALELKSRKDGTTKQTSVAIEPAQLQPQQEGSYSLKLPIQDYASIKLVGLKADPESTLIAFTSAEGKKRAPERFEPKTIVVKRPTKPGEFINSPDNPGRVP